MKTFSEFINESSIEKISKDFSKQTGIKKDDKNIGKGDVFFLKDGSSIIIGANGTRIDYYDKDMEFITSYTSVKQAIKALNQSGLIDEEK